MRVTLKEEPPIIQQSRKFKDYMKANWKGFKEEINNKLIIERNFDNNQSLENKVREVTKIIQEATENNIPVKNCRRNSRIN